MRYLSLCIIVKDEDRAIREWVAHHALLGVEHFFIFDNESRVPVARVLRDFPPALFTFFEVAGKEQQIPSYGRCLQECGHTSRWIGFIDADEFLVPLQGSDLRPLLAEYEPYAGLALPWTMFGSSGHVRRPAGLMMESYLHRYPDHAKGWHQVIKCLVDPARIQAVRDPHRFQPVPGHHLVNEQHLPVPPGANRVVRSCTRLQLNHYFFKSKEEWDAKLSRGRADRADAEGRYPATYFDDQARHATQLDRHILRFAPGVRTALARPDSLASKAMSHAAEKVELAGLIAQSMQALDAGNLELAHIVLCRVAAEHGDMGEVWLLRAMLARLAGQLHRAAFFIRQAMQRAETPDIYLELLHIAHAQGLREQARGALLCLDNIVWQQGVGEQWQTRQAEAARLVAAMA